MPSVRNNSIATLREKNYLLKFLPLRTKAVFCFSSFSSFYLLAMYWLFASSIKHLALSLHWLLALSLRPSALGIRIQPVLPFRIMIGKLIKRSLMLSRMYGVMRSQVPVLPYRIGIGQRIIFMVTHDGEGIATIHHAPHNLQHLPYRRSAIDIIAHKNTCLSG